MLQRAKSLVKVLYPRVGTRVVVPFLVVIILIAAVSVFTVTNLVTGSIQERFNNQLLESAGAASAALLETERSMLESVRAMVFTVGVAEAMADGNIDSLQSLLTPLAVNDSVDELLVYGTEGRVMFGFRLALSQDGVQIEQLPTDVALDWPGALQAAAGVEDEHGDKFADIVVRDGEGMLFISGPVTVNPGRENERVVGGLSVGYALERVARFTEAQSLSSIAFLGASGQVIASTFRADDDQGLGLSAAMAAQRMEQVLTSSPVVETELSGQAYQVMYAPFAIRGREQGLMAVGLPSRYIVQQSGVSRNLVAGLFVGLFVIVSVVGVGVARSIIFPVTRLVDTTRAIIQGDLQRRVRLALPDELGELGDSVDKMTDDLVQRNVQIAALYKAQLQETAQREAVLTNINDAVIVQDPVGNIIQQNVTAFRLMSSVMAVPEQQALFDRILQSHGASPQEADQIIELAGGYYSVKQARVTMETGELVGRVTTFTDLTAIIRAERLKDELILQMSHELRTPLAVLRGNVDLVRLIEKKNLSAKGITFLDRSVEQLRILERMLNQVVDVSSIIAGKFYIERRTLNLVELVQQRAAEWAPRFSERGLTLSVELPAVPMPLEGDGTRIEQVVDHVLRNAHSYTLKGSVTLELLLDEDKAKIIVTDTGVGIEAGEIDHVFERMFRGSASHAGPTDSRGMGLGLYLSKHIVEMHDGRISVHSAPQQGTRVEIELPLATETDLLRLSA